MPRRPTPEEWKARLREIEDGLRERFPETRERLSRGRYLTAYAHGPAEIAYLSATYRHTVRPEFDTAIVDLSTGRVRTFRGHPRLNGATAKNGFSVDPEYDGNW